MIQKYLLVKIYVKQTPVNKNSVHDTRVHEIKIASVFEKKDPDIYYVKSYLD